MQQINHTFQYPKVTPVVPAGAPKPASAPAAAAAPRPTR
jgi:hypothetical protein